MIALCHWPNNNQSNKISKKTNKLINYTQEEMCFNVEYSMEYLLRELNYQYLEELKFQRENLVNDQIYGDDTANLRQIIKYDYKIKDVEKTIEDLNQLYHLS